MFNSYKKKFIIIHNYVIIMYKNLFHLTLKLELECMQRIHMKNVIR